jgi:plastocyanin
VLSSGTEYKVNLFRDRAEPSELSVRRGETVTFYSADDTRHDLAEERSNRKDARLVSGEFGSDESYSVTFHDQGSFSFYDRLNPDTNISVTIR